VVHVDVPPERFRAGVVQAGVDPVYADAMVEAAGYFGAAATFVDTAAVERASGAPARPIDDVILDQVVPALNTRR
jgi:hypothetical protein